MSMLQYFNQRNDVTDRMVDDHMKQLTREYKEANKAVRGQLEAVHRKYSINGKLTHADMTKYNRLVNLEKSINKELGRVSGITTRNTKTLASNIYEESFFRTAFAIEKDAMLNLGFGQISPKTIEAAVANPYQKIALENNKDAVRKAIRSDITQGLLQGEAYTDTAKRVQKSLEQNLNNAERIARTEAHRAREIAAMDSMEHAQKMGIQMQKQWVSAIDQRTRDTHAAMDGQRVDVDENFISPEGATGPAPGEMGAASEDINCRCTSIAIIEGYEPEQRRIRGEGNAYDAKGNLTEKNTVPFRTYAEHAEAKGWPMKYKGPEPRISLPQQPLLKPDKYKKYNIKEEDWENWAADPEPFQEYLIDNTEPRFVSGQQLSPKEIEDTKKAAVEIQARAATNRMKDVKGAYRGESYNSVDDVLKVYKQNERYEADKLLSFGRDMDIAETYAGYRGGGNVEVIINVTSPKGFNGIMTDPLGVGGSDEFVSALGKSFKVTAVDVKQDKVFVYLFDDAPVMKKSEALLKVGVNM